MSQGKLNLSENKLKMSGDKTILSQDKMNLPPDQRPFSGFPRPPSEGQPIENEVKITHRRFFTEGRTVSFCFVCFELQLFIQ